jgi:hypothetical protein
MGGPSYVTSCNEIATLHIELRDELLICTPKAPSSLVESKISCANPALNRVRDRSDGSQLRNKTGSCPGTSRRRQSRGKQNAVCDPERKRVSTPAPHRQMEFKV